MKDPQGNLICEPLKNSSSYCKLRLRVFCTKPVSVEDPSLFYLDFETSGLNVLQDHIVEIGVLCEHSECFSTVVCPPVFGNGPNVHGIVAEELREGPSFAEAFKRLFRFCENVAESAVCDDGSSDEDEVIPTILKESPPRILIVAHNGFLVNKASNLSPVVKLPMYLLCRNYIYKCNLSY